MGLKFGLPAQELCRRGGRRPQTRRSRRRARRRRG